MRASLVFASADALALTVPPVASGLNLNVFIGVIEFLNRKDISQGHNGLVSRLTPE